MNSKNVDILRHIIRYCGLIQDALQYFEIDRAAFTHSFHYRSMLAMYILQIGELTQHLTEDFKLEFPQAPWRDIKGMRNVFAHNYENSDPGITWETITERIPELRETCLEIAITYDSSFVPDAINNEEHDEYDLEQ
ncbi:antitoxin [Clostridia bacterium]|nr:antitoxin [Clostridia bacterium]